MQINPFRLAVTGGVLAVAALAFVVGGESAVDGARFVVLAAVLLVGAGMWWRERMLSGPLRRIAAANGWTFARSAPSLGQGWTGTPFADGDERKATSVIRGAVGGRAFTAFNWTVTRKTGRDRVTSYYSVVALDERVDLPPVEVLRTLGGVEQAIGLDRFEVENEEFNRRFRVGCRDRKLASDVLNPRTIEALLAGKVVNARIGGGRVVAWAPGRLEVVEVLAWSRALATVLDRVPGFVWDDHAGGAPGARLTWEPGPSSLGAVPPSPQESS